MYDSAPQAMIVADCLVQGNTTSSFCNNTEVEVMKDDDSTINGICSQVGISPVAFNEVLRRIRRVVIEDNAQVISKVIGTFYRRDSKATTRTLNGVVYDVPARSCVQLRSSKVVDEQGRCELDPLSSESGELLDNDRVELEQSFPSFQVGSRFDLLMEVTQAGDVDSLAGASGHPFFRSQVSVVSSQGVSVVSILRGVNQLLNGGFQFGYVDHPSANVVLGDKFGLAFEVLSVDENDLVQCRVDKVLNGAVSTSTVENFLGCNLNAVFETVRPDTSLIFDLTNGDGFAPIAQRYEVVVR